MVTTDRENFRNGVIFWNRSTNRLYSGRSFLLLLFLISFFVSPAYSAGQTHTIGDTILKTDQLRNLTGADGMGIGVGVISNGVDGLYEAQLSGELPSSVLVLSPGSGAEGTAMLEIIHDIAPGATLLFHDFGGGPQSGFVAAVEGLIAAGARVIVDDVGFLQVPYFEDGYTAKRLNEILDAHPEVILVTAAGNNAEVHYEGVYADDGSGYHSFNGEPGIPVAIQPGGSFSIFLQWDDIYGQSGNDYNLYLEENGDLIALSERIQDGTSIPEEKFTYYNDRDALVQAIIRIKPASQNVEIKTLKLFINADPSRVYISKPLLTKDGSIIGQATVPRIISVAAVSPDQVNAIERYSSQGFVTIRYPEVSIRQKPDITGINKVRVSGAGGFPQLFAGTSAAAPHIAGLLAIQMSLFPEFPAEELKEALFTTTLRLGGKPGWDYAFGYGLPDALKMYNKLKETSPVNPLPPSLTNKQIEQFIQSDQQPILSGTGIITGPVVITNPGTYTIGEDFASSAGTIITIMASDVTILGQGRYIEGLSVQFIESQSIEQHAIVVESPDGTILENIVIEDIGISGSTHAIIGKQTENLRISRCTIIHNTNGIGLFGAESSIIEENYLSGNSYKGLAIRDGSSNTLVKGNTIEKNLYGIDTTGSINTILEDNIIRDNRRADEFVPAVISPTSNIVQPIPSGLTPCPDSNYDGICDDPNATLTPTPKPTSGGSSQPFSYSSEFTMTTITYPTSHGSYPTPTPTYGGGCSNGYC